MLKKLLIIILVLISTITGVCAYSIYRGDDIIMPVVGAKKTSYDQNSFGAPRVGHLHKGVDIFAKKGTPIRSATNGLVIFNGVLSLGGNVVLVVSPGFRFYYYAHLDSIKTAKFKWVGQGDIIGTVGKTGNARFTPAHLHFSISRFYFPFGRGFINPVPVLNSVYK